MSNPVAEFEHRFADLLAHVGDLNVAALLDALQTRSLEPDETAIVQGEPHDSLLLVEWGQLVVEVKGVEVSRLGPGEVAGEVGLLDPGLATATVKAAEPTMIHVLTAEVLEQLWTEHPAVASSLVQGLTRVVSERLRSIEGDLDKLAGDQKGGVLGVLKRLFGRAA